jgi:diguanylate cyclase (GGDEF)-like protein
MGCTMKQFRKRIRRVLLIVMTLLFITISAVVPALAEGDPVLTKEERAYIAQAGVIKAVSLKGGAPIQYADAQGEVQGISRGVLEIISEMTGLNFEYRLYDTLQEALESDADIIFGIPNNYAPHDMVLSRPFLKSETILYINSSVDADKLEDKIYAAVKGSALPEGIKEEYSIYFDTREDSLDAVEAGKADYGYGNAYSVTYYALQKGYKNIVTIPKAKETREYCIGLLKDNKLLLSIIDKSISVIDEMQMQNLILNVATNIDRKITISMILDAYGEEILMVFFVIISVLILSAFSNAHVNNDLRMQNRRYEVLSHISNEYLYEYFPKSDVLKLSEKCTELFDSPEILNKATRKLKDILSEGKFDEHTATIKLPLDNGKSGVFRLISSRVLDHQGRLDSVIGKLIDISEEVAEKEELLIKAQRDGLTGLYNAITTKELIEERIKNKDENEADAFILIDCDNLKETNDNYGHLTGNRVLEHVGERLKHSFRSTDIIGRLGGDEFCVYMKDIPSADFVRKKCQKILIQELPEGMKVTMSIGIALVKEKRAYEGIFTEADEALYQAKQNGRAQVVVNGSFDHRRS